MSHATRTVRRTGIRSSAGLAVAALVIGGLTCHGSASAAEPVTTGLGFAPTDLVTVGNDVFAVGTSYVYPENGDPEVSRGHVARIAADGTPAKEIDLGAGSTARALTARKDGTLAVIGSSSVIEEDAPVQAPTAWTLDTGLVEEPEAGFGPSGTELLDIDSRGDRTAMLGTSNGASWVSTEPDGPIQISTAGSPDKLAIGQDATYAAGTRWIGDDDGVATAWVLTEDGDDNSVDTFAVGATDHDSVDALVTDPTSGLAYVATSESEDYDNAGVTVIDGSDRTYVPLERPARALAVSADGETLYAASSGAVSAYATDALDSYDDDENRVPTSSVDSSASAMALGANGSVHVADNYDEVVETLTRPAAPAGLKAVPDPLSTTDLVASWAEGKYDYELEDADTEYWELPEYLVTVRNDAGDVVSSQTTRSQVQAVSDLAAGKAYAVTVTVVDGALRSPVASASVTTHARHLTAPSGLAVAGSLTVGSTLSARTTGAWEAGTAVSYEWGYSGGEYGGFLASGPTVTLTKAQLGMRISLIATGTKAGVAGVSKRVFTTGKVTAKVAPALSGPKPKVKGSAKVGKVLVATPGRWPSGTKLTYRWSANGKRIAGATAVRLRLTKAHAGKRITVTVTATKPGHSAAVRTSAPTTKVTAVKSKKKPAKGKNKGKKGKRN